ncbi:MAG: CoA transferase [Chloroflexota bacterium]|nr:MAG: CoA transferase [Chloroflexota bacterium]
MGRMALEHIRIIDLCQAWSGAYATQILADLGAEVIKVEARQRPDPWRCAVNGSLRYQLARSFADNEPGERQHNRSYLANSVNRNKSSLTLDLTRERGREIFRELVRSADVVTENFTPRVMGNFDLDFAALKKLRPQLIMLSMPAFGGTGPYRELMGVGATIESMSGNSYLLGYEGGLPLMSGIMWSDPVASVMGAAAVLTALYHRERKGRGQHIDLSQQESMLSMIGYHVVAHSLTGEAPQLQENRDPLMVPHRNYQCQGKDQWVAIAARDDADWRHLCRTIDRADLTKDSRFATAAARLENRAVVDLIIEEWTKARPVAEVETALQTAGVPVGKVRSIPEIFACPQVKARRFFTSVDHPEVGRRTTAGISVRLSRSPGKIRRAAPCLGADSADILRRYLGLSDEEIAKLVAEGITGEELIFPPANGGQDS